QPRPGPKLPLVAFGDGGRDAPRDEPALARGDGDLRFERGGETHAGRGWRLRFGHGRGHRPHSAELGADPSNSTHERLTSMRWRRKISSAISLSRMASRWIAALP